MLLQNAAKMVREMIGGCCVCLDERGWNENPLVYCDGTGCSVAVHQACYGIRKVPSGPWFCSKCCSQERVAKVKCELCPNREGALKRTDKGGWAHVVCALYIPEVRFGDVATMEPIIYSSVPSDRFSKACYLCDEGGRESRSGACMTCHKPGCKMSFHVTCAQARRLLCEEGSINGHVQYVGYCISHWTKRIKMAGSNGSVIAADEQETKRIRTLSSSGSTNSIDTSTAIRPKAANVASTKERRSIEVSTGDSGLPGVSQPKDARKASPESVSNSNTELSPPQINSPLNTPLTDEQHSVDPFDHHTVQVTQTNKKRKITETYKKKRQIEDLELKKAKVNSNKKKEKNTKEKEKINLKRLSIPQPSQLGLVEDGNVGFWDGENKKEKPAENFQLFLEQVWSDSANFISSKSQSFDAASLLSCLHQLKSDNAKLEDKLAALQARRDRLIGLNARLSFIEAKDPLKYNGISNNAISHHPKNLSQLAAAPDSKNNVLSDLAMLAATSAKIESNNTATKYHSVTDPPDEKPPIEHSENRMFAHNEFFGKDLIKSP